MEQIDAQRVFGYALFKDGKNTRLSYPLEKFHADVSGRSFHNGRFIQRMREKAASLPKYVYVSSLLIYNLMIFPVLRAIAGACRCLDCVLGFISSELLFGNSLPECITVSSLIFTWDLGLFRCLFLWMLRMCH